MTDTLMDLIERVEKAEADDSNLDADIAKAIGWTRSTPKGLKFEYWFSPTGARINPPRYTASVDAAMTLAPEGWRRWMLDADNGDGLCQLEHEDTDREVHSRGKTWPLALCAASLKARMGTGG